MKPDEMKALAKDLPTKRLAIRDGIQIRRYLWNTLTQEGPIPSDEFFVGWDNPLNPKILLQIHPGLPSRAG